MLFRFGEFAFYPDTRALLRQGTLVHLAAKAQSLLEVLVRKAPLPVSKAELLQAVWSETPVTEGNLATLVLEIRRALGDDLGETYVKTIHRYGYAFVAKLVRPSEADVIACPNRFLVWIGGHRVGLAEGVNWIGRATDCRVQVDCPLASRHHARITISDLQALLEDGPSRHGTFLGGKKLKGPSALKGGEDLRIGSMRMTFRSVNPDAPTDPK